jgi:hypothetical protein
MVRILRALPAVFKTTEDAESTELKVLRISGSSELATNPLFFSNGNKKWDL